MRQKRKQSTAKDGYEPPADEDDDSYEKSESECVAPVENLRRRNRGKRRLMKNACNLQDPLVVCGFDIMLMILSHLDARSVASSLVVCRRSTPSTSPLITHHSPSSTSFLSQQVSSHSLSIYTQIHSGVCRTDQINFTYLVGVLSSFIVQSMRQKREQSTAKDGYEPSADEDDDSYEKSESECVAPVENLRRRNRGKRRLMKNGCNLQDPLVVCGFDIMLMILSHLDARSVASSLVVSRRWRRVACSDTIWSEKVKELWADKAHLPRLALVEGLSKLSAYTLSIQDGKRGAPEYWRNLDPYWRGTGPSMHRYFHEDGSHTADPNDQVWGGHECCYTIVTSFLADGKIREHYVRINSWPQLYVSRRQDWGWEMSNHLYFYSSVPDAYKKGGTGPYLPVH
ncbi:hypothetical protein LXL04_033323 [Taraxacum kok-saghyz]